MIGRGDIHSGQSSYIVLGGLIPMLRHQRSLSHERKSMPMYYLRLDEILQLGILICEIINIVLKLTKNNSKRK